MAEESENPSGTEFEPEPFQFDPEAVQLSDADIERIAEEEANAAARAAVETDDESIDWDKLLKDFDEDIAKAKETGDMAEYWNLMSKKAAAEELRWVAEGDSDYILGDYLISREGNTYGDQLSKLLDSDTIASSEAEYQKHKKEFETTRSDAEAFDWASFLSNFTGVGGLLKGGLKWLIKKGAKQGLKKWLRRLLSKSFRERIKKRIKKKVKECLLAARSNPVRIASGAPVQNDPGFEFRGLSPLIISSLYVGDMDHYGPLGRNRIGTTDSVIFVSPDDPGTLVYLPPDGVRVSFKRPKPVPGEWETGDSIDYLELAQGPKRRLLLREKQETTTFKKYRDGLWRPEKITDSFGTEIVHERSQTGALLRIKTPEEIHFTFAYNDQQLRKAVFIEAQGGARREILSYRYDARGNMTVAEAAYGDRHEYGYDDENNRIYFNLNGTYIAHYRFEAGRVVGLQTNGPFNGDRFIYDMEGKVVLYDPGGLEENRIRYDLTEEGAIAREVNALGYEKRYYYEGGFLVRSVDGLGNDERQEFDKRGNLKKYCDGEGRESFFYWNALGGLDTALDPASNSWDYLYGPNGDLTAIKDPLGHRTEFINNKAGQPVKVMRHDGLIEFRTYDRFSRLVELVDYRGEKTKYEYDVFGRPVAVIDALGQKTVLEYLEQKGFDFWSPSRIVRPDGTPLQSVRLVSRSEMHVTDGVGRRVAYRFGSRGVLSEMEDPSGRTLRFVYDGQELLVKVVNQLGQEWTFERDRVGRVVRETDFSGLVTGYAYDKADRLIEAYYEDGARLAYFYDKSSLPIREEVYGATGVLADTVHYAYDGCGLLDRTENGSAVVEFQRDKLGRVISEVLNGREMKSAYDCCGNRVSREIGGRLIEQTYDPLGALRSLRVVDHAPLTFKYDAAGRELSRESAAGFRLEHTYDSIGQLLKQVAGFSLSALGAGMEGARQAQKLGIDPQRAPMQVERSYSWTKAFEPLTVTDGRWGKTEYGYDANGQIERTVFADGVAERFSYDEALNIAGFGAGAGPGSKQYVVSGGAGSGYTSPVDKGRFERWLSSGGGRVNEASGPNGERVRLTYDIRGRVTERHVERNGFRARTWRYEWNTKDRLIACVTPEQERWTYGYDPFGRRVHKINATKARLAAKAAGIILHGDELPGAFHEERALPKEAGEGGQARVGVAYSWDGDNLAEEAPLALDGTILWDDAIRWHYEPGGFQPLAKEEPGGELLYIVTDHLGTPREMFSEDGRLQWAADYRTWGSVRKLWRADPDNDNLPLRENAEPKGIDHLSGGKIQRSTSVSGVTYGNLALRDDLVWQEAVLQCPIRFQGQWEDAETGLHYNRHRHYDPLAGQYISRDPIGFIGGFRPFGYVFQPTTMTDPEGLSPSSDLAANMGVTYNVPWAAHHIIPTKVWQDNAALMKAIGMPYGAGKNDYPQQAINGIALPTEYGNCGALEGRSVHRGPHVSYSAFVNKGLKQIESQRQKDLKNKDKKACADGIAKAKVLAFREMLRQALLNGAWGKCQNGNPSDAGQLLRVP